MINVNKKQLIFIDAVIWAIAGLILLFRAYTWVELLSENQLFIILIASIPLGLIKTRFIFIRLTKKNIKRIYNFAEEKVSIYNFHTLRDKMLIVIMIFLGALLRQSSLPKFILMPVYIGIGVSMIYVCVMYFQSYFSKKTKY